MLALLAEFRNSILNPKHKKPQHLIGQALRLSNFGSLLSYVDPPLERYLTLFQKIREFTPRGQDKNLKREGGALLAVILIKKKNRDQYFAQQWHRSGYLRYNGTSSVLRVFDAFISS